MRQGCPLSCVLFNIFINDLFDDLPYSGATIPSGSVSQPIEPALVIPGLLFADDALGLAETKDELVLLCTHIGQ